VGVDRSEEYISGCTIVVRLDLFIYIYIYIYSFISGISELVELTVILISINMSAE
jgi:hypothetical protein